MSYSSHLGDVSTDPAPAPGAGPLPPPPAIPAEREDLPGVGPLVVWGLIAGVCGYIFWSTTTAIGTRRA